MTQADRDASQTGLVDRQFGPQAGAYVASAVHARGPDLDHLAALAAEGDGNARLLDLGCGGGHVAYTVAPHVAEVVACDLSSAMLDAVRGEAARRNLANIATERAEAARLPFPDGAFDWVMSRYSAHHWPDLEAGLREAARVLKPGGRAAFADVIAPAGPVEDSFLQTVELLRDPSHARDASEREWRGALAAAGLRPVAARPGRLHLDFASWIARMNTDPVHVAAIRSLQAGAPEAVRRHFEIEADGSFTVDTLVIEAVRA